MTELLFLVAIIVAALALLDVAAIKWGIDSRTDPRERPNWW